MSSFIKTVHFKDNTTRVLTPEDNNYDFSNTVYYEITKDGVRENYVVPGSNRVIASVRIFYSFQFEDRYYTNGVMVNYEGVGIFREASIIYDVLTDKPIIRTSYLNGKINNYTLNGVFNPGYREFDGDRISTEIYYTNGEKNNVEGKYAKTTYWTNNNIATRSSFVNNRLVNFTDKGGAVEEYYSDNKLKIDITIKDNIVYVRENYHNGKLKCASSYNTNWISTNNLSVEGVDAAKYKLNYAKVLYDESSKVDKAYIVDTTNKVVTIERAGLGAEIVYDYDESIIKFNYMNFII